MVAGHVLLLVLCDSACIIWPRTLFIMQFSFMRMASCANVYCQKEMRVLDVQICLAICALPTLHARIRDPGSASTNNAF